MPLLASHLEEEEEEEGGRILYQTKCHKHCLQTTGTEVRPCFLSFPSRSDFDFLIFLLFFSLLLYFFGFHSILVFDTIFCSFIIAASISNHLHQSYRIF